MMTDPENIECVACGRGLEVRGLGVDYYSCPGCRTLHLRPLPAVETNEAFTSEEVAAEMARTDLLRSTLFQRRIAMLPRPDKGPERFRLLDVGCSSGRLLALARQCGWHVTGVEMSDNLAREASKANPEARIFVGDIMGLDPGKFTEFDAVVALDVIEHVLDPPLFLQRMGDLLVPGGYLMLQTPHAGSLRARLHGQAWNMRIPEYHFHLFSEMGMTRLLEAGGYEIQKMTTVSGSGLESGMGIVLSGIKEWLLSRGMLGNALLVLARKRR